MEIQALVNLEDCQIIHCREIIIEIQGLVRFKDRQNV